MPGTSDLVFFTGATTTTGINTDKSVLGLRFSGTGNHTINAGPVSGALGVGSGGIRVEGNQTVNFDVWVRPTTTGAFQVYNDGILNLNSASNFQTTAPVTATFSGSGTTTVSKFSRRRPTYDLTLIKEGTGTLIITGSENAASLPDVTGPPAVVGTPGYITGDVTVNGGLLLANNTSGSATGGGNVTVNANGRIGGTGSITGGDTKTISLNSGQLLVGTTHAAGGVARALQLGSSTTFALGGVTSTSVNVDLAGTLQFDITGTGVMTAIGTESYDTLANNDLLRINTTGNVDLSGSTIQIAAANTTGWAEGQTWKVIDWSAATPGTVNTSNLALSTNFVGGWYLVPTIVTTGTGAGYYLTASTVPEPGRAVLVLLGVSALIFARRR